jgi:hypothetical protein
MRGPEHYDRERVADLLRQAYKGKELLVVGEGWRMRLMARIREMDPERMKVRFLPSFEHFVWRLAPVTTPLVLILIALLFKLDMGAGLDTLQMLMSSVEDFTLAQFFAA